MPIFYLIPCLSEWVVFYHQEVLNVLSYTALRLSPLPPPVGRFHVMDVLGVTLQDGWRLGIDLKRRE